MRRTTLKLVLGAILATVAGLLVFRLRGDPQDASAPYPVSTLRSSAAQPAPPALGELRAGALMPSGIDVPPPPAFGATAPSGVNAPALGMPSPGAPPAGGTTGVGAGR